MIIIGIRIYTRVPRVCEQHLLLATERVIETVAQWVALCNVSLSFIGFLDIYTIVQPNFQRIAPDSLFAMPLPHCMYNNNPCSRLGSYELMC